MSASPRLLRAYELREFRSTAFSNEAMASLRLPRTSWARPSTFQALERLGVRSTASFAIRSAPSPLPAPSSLRAPASACDGSISWSSSSSSSTLAAVGCSLGCSSVATWGVGVVGTGAGGNSDGGGGAATIGFATWWGDGDRSLQAARPAATARAIESLVIRSVVVIGNGLLSDHRNCSVHASDARCPRPLYSGRDCHRRLESMQNVEWPSTFRPSASAVGSRCSRPMGGASGVGDVRQNGARPGQQRGAGGQKANATRGALEQLHAELVLE